MRRAELLLSVSEKSAIGLKSYYAQFGSMNFPVSNALTGSVFFFLAFERVDVLRN